MILRDEMIQQLVALHFMPKKELEHLCLQRSDDFVDLLDNLQLRFPAHKAAIGRIWADTFNVAYVDIESTRIEPQVASRLDFDFALREEIIAMYEFDVV